jgi:predicted O-methyltransferase YrrM
VDKDLSDLLRVYEARSQSELTLMGTLSPAELEQRLDEFLLYVGPGTGQFLNTLARDSGARRILELGTSYGYSTLWLADAARATGGKVTSLELHPGKRKFALEQLAKVRLDAVVDIKLGNATQIIPTLDGAIDFVLVDLWKELYVRCFDLFLPKLAPGAFVIADNMLQPEASRPQTDAYRRHLRASGRFDTVLLPIGSGIEVSRLVR